MPKYATSGSGSLVPNSVLPAVMSPGDHVYVWGTSVAAGNPPTPGQIQAPNDYNVIKEVVVAGERSIAVALNARPGGGTPASVIVQITASANPGAAEIDVQDAAIDADGAYITPVPLGGGTNPWKINSWTGPLGDGVSYTAWAELSPEIGPFTTLKCISNPNGVNFAAKYIYV